MSKSDNGRELVSAPALNPSVPAALHRRLLFLPDRARSMGIHILAGKGSGKSRLLGRVLAWLDFLRGVPLVILDPNGPSIDNFLDKLAALPQREQEALWQRVRYVDMSGQGGRVVPFPLYYRLSQESLYAVSQRYLDILRKVDPQLASASMQGWNALWRIGTYTGMILAALDYQITEAEHLITNPAAWEHRLAQAVHTYPEVMPAVRFFTKQVATWKPETHASRTDAFLNKISLFSLDPTMQAMFGSSTPGLAWSQVVQERQVVLLDFRHEHDLERRRFKMLWVFHAFLDFIKYRGAGRHQPISLIVDELTALTNFQTLGGPGLFAADLDELINVIARNYGVWLTLAHQEMFQVDERTAKSLLTMGTQIFGSSADMDAALLLAKTFFPIDPYQVKRHEPVYTSYQGAAEVIDYRPVEFSIEEQHYQQAYQIKNQGAFHFLVRPAPGEGEVQGGVYPVSIAGFDRNQWVNEELVAQARSLLRQQGGVPVDPALAAIRSRLPVEESHALPRRSGTMKEYAHTLPAPPTGEDDDEILREEK